MLQSLPTPLDFVGFRIPFSNFVMGDPPNIETLQTAHQRSPDAHNTLPSR
jgi:hypothetical protein